MTDKIDTRYLETLLGYNTRRATLTIISRFIERMAEFDLRPVDFSVLSLIGHNPGITSRELCNALNILPPNMVGFLKAFEKRDLIERTLTPRMDEPWVCRSPKKASNSCKKQKWRPLNQTPAPRINSVQQSKKH